MKTLPLPFGAGLDRYTGAAAVDPGSMADVRNMLPERGKLRARKGSQLRSELPAQTNFDLATNGAFALDADWTKGTSWQIAAGVASQAAPTASSIEQNVAVVSGLSYQVTYTVAGQTVGGILVSVGGAPGTLRNTNGEFIETIVAGSSTLLTFAADGTWDGNISAVSITFVGANACTSVPLVHALQSQQEGVAVGFYADSRQVHVYRTGAAGTDPVHVSLWGALRDGARASFTAAESYGKVYLAHDEPSLGWRLDTVIYNALASSSLEPLQANLDGGGLAPIKFRGVLTWSNYLVGWGYGMASGETRPELVRVSLPGQPEMFDPEHYFIAGDRGSAVTTVRPAGNGLVAFKPSSSYHIVGTSHLNFGILPLYSLIGCLGGRLAVTIEERCYFWSSEGPRVTTIGGEGDLEAPLNLEGPDPVGFPELTDTANGFAVYIPSERVVEWHFGDRVFALSLDEQEGPKWGYRTRAFAAAGGGILYYGGVPLGESPDTAPTGYAVVGPIAAAGTEATVEWTNVTAAGDESLEMWLRIAGGTWAEVPPATFVTIATPQQRVLTGLAIDTDYDVAVRYRRGGQYRSDYTSPNPSDWPAGARGTFRSTPLAPVLSSVGWARISSGVERARVTFTPAAGHEGFSHRIYRIGSLAAIVDPTLEPTLVGTVAPGVVEFDDTTVSGEEYYDWTVRTLVSGGVESPASNLIALFMGLYPGPSAATYALVLEGAFGLNTYEVNWTNGIPSLPTEILGGTTSPRLFDPGVTMGNVEVSSWAGITLTVRHRQSTFGTLDYSPAASATEAP